MKIKLKDIYSILLEKIKKISFQKLLLKNIHAEEIHSGILLVIYAVCLSIGFYLFSSFNFVPTRSLDITIEELESRVSSTREQRLPKAEIEIHIPMKLQGSSQNLGDLSFNLHNDNSWYINSSSKESSPSSSQNDKLDSLRNAFEGKYGLIDSVDKNLKYLNYIQVLLDTDETIAARITHQNEDGIFDWYPNTHFVETHCDKLNSKKIVYSANSSDFLGTIYSFSTNTVLGTPHWFLLSDLSQAYYNIKIHTATFNKLTLSIDFVGATDFSRMKPEPDNIGMSSISFTDLDKIEQIKKDGLMFHAEFKEMKNKQNVRNFILTSLMALIIGAIVKEILVLSYHLITSARKRKEYEQN